MEEKARNVKEERRIDAILPSLRNEGLITDFECRIIATQRRLHRKQSAVYRVIMSKSSQEAAKLTEIFRTLTVSINAEEKSKLQNNAGCEEPEVDSMSPLTPKKNPFLNNTVIACLFEYLPLDDIKNCRFVCQQWNSTAEIYLRKRSFIHIRPSVLHPETFLQVSKYSLPDLPFSAFKFSTDEVSTMRVSDLEDFFNKWGKNIKQVEFNQIRLQSSANPKTCLANYDATSWFTNTSNMTQLCITYPKGSREGKDYTSLNISFDKLVPVENLILHNCSILTETKKEYPRIAPLNIGLIGVIHKRDNKICDEFRLNEYFDFSLATDIYLSSQISSMSRSRPATFDAGYQVLNTDEIHLDGIIVENWAGAKGEVQDLQLSGGVPFVEKNQLKIKKLHLEDSQINLSVLPQTIKKLYLSRWTAVCTEPLQLPNLKQLVLDPAGNNLSLMTHFANCSSLLELLLIGDSPDLDIPPMEILDNIPKSVTRLKMQGVHLKVEVNASVLELDTLILEQGNHTVQPVDFNNVVRKIKPKNLVIVYFRGMDLGAFQMMKLISLNPHIEKVFIGSHNEDNMHEDSSLEESKAFFECVDKKSNYYLFEKQVGKAITREEFETWRFLDGEEKDKYNED